MSFSNIKTKLQAQRGFTIVELLIVIVVIGILAAITIVSYNGITNRANTNSAKANATSFLKKAEIYAADGTTGKYPIVDTDLTSDSSKSYYVASSLIISYSTTAITSSTTSAVSTVRVLKCSSAGSTVQSAINATNIVGLKAYYVDFTTGVEATTPLTVGNTTNCSTT